jgi:distribution and morphology protein 10
MINPAMGHYSTSYTRPMSKELNISTRYDFNAYSLKSDLAVGFEFEREGQVLKARVGFEDGVGCKLEVKREWGVLGVGFESTLGSGGRARTSIGMEIQISI